MVLVRIESENMRSAKDSLLKVGILGIPLGFGAGRTGSELGVDAMRLSKIRGKHLSDHISELGYVVTDHGDVEIVKPNRVAPQDENPKYLDEMIMSSTNISDSVKK